MRVVVFASFDLKGVIHQYVLTYLEKLHQVCDKMIFIADNDATLAEQEKIKPWVDYFVFSKHGEYDFGSYKRGWEWIKKQSYFDEIDEIVFCNDSCFCVGEIKPVFDKMSCVACDFWGMTEGSSCTRHLQSFFLVFKRNVFCSKIFNTFFCSVKKEKSVIDVVLNYELPLQGLLEREGFVASSFIKGIKSAHQRALSTLKHGMPLVKKKIFLFQQGPMRAPSLENLGSVFRKIKQISPKGYQEILVYFHQSLLKIKLKFLIAKFIFNTRHFLCSSKITKKKRYLIKICKIPVYAKKITL